MRRCREASFVGALIIARRPGNRIGQLLVCGALSFAAFLAVGGYVTSGWEGGKDLPGLAWAAWVTNWVWMPALVALLLLLLLYPDGRLVPVQRVVHRDLRGATRQVVVLRPRCTSARI